MKYHWGELEVQRRAGVDEGASRVSGIIRSTIPSSAQDFLLQQPIAIAATVDRSDQPSASLLTGEPGFMRALDEQTVMISGLPFPKDALNRNLKVRNEIGILTIEFATRRRAKIKGEAEILNPAGLLVRTKRVYALCPKYIQARSPEKIEASEEAKRSSAKSRKLNPFQRDWIQKADTFFIASFHPETGADASHRGGLPGFVRVVDSQHLLFPDYPGNHMFNTLGNITANPKAGLLFIDFETGSILQIQGAAQIHWEPQAATQFAGAERVVELAIHRVIQTTRAIEWKWRFHNYSPFNPKSA
jgi:uncharacterized protein